MGASLPLEMIVLAKAIAHWLSVSLPLALMAPFLGMLLNIDMAAMLVLGMAMALGSLSLSLLASIGGAITAGLRRGGLLVALLVMPLYVPVLIFGLSTTLAQNGPNGAGSSLIVLLALTLISLAIQPFAAAAALRAYLK